MINFIETLFGITVVAIAAAIVMYWRGNRPAARKLGWLAAVAGAVAGVLEVYVRL
jgi:hypothetical protein